MNEEQQGNFRCLYCAHVIEITPDLPDELDCPNCGRHLVVPGRVTVNVGELDQLLKSNAKAARVDNKIIATWIITLTMMNFLCYFLATAVSVPIIHGLLAVIFLLCSTGLFIVGINLLLRNR